MLTCLWVFVITTTVKTQVISITDILLWCAVWDLLSSPTFHCRRWRLIPCLCFSVLFCFQVCSRASLSTAMLASSQLPSLTANLSLAFQNSLYIHTLCLFCIILTMRHGSYHICMRLLFNLCLPKCQREHFFLIHSVDSSVLCHCAHGRC